MDLGDLRYEYTKYGLKREDLADDPLNQFEHWYGQAVDAELPQPNAMSLATVAANGEPSSRIVLLKSYDQQGFVFYTNYESRKAQNIAVNDQVALLFFWVEFERQIKIRGHAERISAAESLRYFASRPRGSQIGAWCSPQSSAIGSRQLLETEFERLKQKFRDREIPLPSHWGGFRIIPHTYEFWQGRANRLHDRFQYQRHDDTWEIERLAP